MTFAESINLFNRLESIEASLADLTTAVDVYGTRLCEAVEVLAGIRQPPPGAPLPWPHDDGDDRQTGKEEPTQ